MQIVWITPKWPFPVTDGARQATTQLLKNLAARGTKIHLLSIVPDGEVVDESHARDGLGVGEVTVLRRRIMRRLRKLWSLIRRPMFPVTVASYATLPIARAIERIIADVRPRFVVYDGLHAAGWRLAHADIRIPDGIREVYRAHNVESDLWRRAAQQTRNPVKKLVLLQQSRVVRQVESRLLKIASFTFPVSSVDEARFAESVDKQKLLTLPIGIPAPELETRSAPPDSGRLRGGRRALFVGRLDWAPNREGLEWVLKEVWPKVLARTRDLSLRIVGAGDGKWLEAYRSLPGVEIVGAVDRLDPYYEECLVTLVPVFYGSGTRVKAIESCLHGRPCISTDLGVEGMGLVPGRHYYRANDADEWAQTLIALDPKHAATLGRDAREYARAVFDPGRVAENFLACVGLTRVAGVDLRQVAE